MSGIFLIYFRKERFGRLLNIGHKQAENPGQKHSGMTALCNGRAFTLIELLVVVLIIGILAAIALPQYQSAVDKAHGTRVLTLARSIQRAQELYYAEYGDYTNQYEELSIDLPVKEKKSNLTFVSTSGDYYEFHKEQTGKQNSQPSSVYVYFKGISAFLIVSYKYSFFRGKVYCYALNTNERAKQLCHNLTHKEPTSSGSWCVYNF